MDAVRVGEMLALPLTVADAVSLPLPVVDAVMLGVKVAVTDGVTCARTQARWGGGGVRRGWLTAA